MFFYFSVRHRHGEADVGVWDKREGTSSFCAKAAQQKASFFFYFKNFTLLKKPADTHVMYAGEDRCSVHHGKSALEHRDGYG